MSQACWRNGAGKMCLIDVLASIEDKGIEIHLLVVRLLDPGSSICKASVLTTEICPQLYILKIKVG